MNANSEIVLRDVATHQRRRLVVSLAAVALLLFSAAARSTDAAPPTLEARLAEIGAASSGVMGVGAVHVESGRRVSLNGRRTFPMASVRKLPLALAVLARVDQGTEDLARRIRVEADDIIPGSRAPAGMEPVAGKALAVRELLELMLIYSDNSAAAVLQRAAAGAALSQARLRLLGIDGIRIDRQPREMQKEIAVVRNKPHRERAAAWARLEADPRDSATPEAMADLLALLQRGGALSADNTALLLGIMRRCATGDARLPARLPQTANVAHKTGTEARSTNDVGIVTLGDGTHLAIAVFITGAQQPIEAREKSIAAAARLVYDFFADGNAWKGGIGDGPN